MRSELTLLATVAALAALTTPSQAQQIPGPYGSPVTLDQAQQLIGRARDAAARRGFTMAVAVVDPAGEPVAFARMDGTQTASIEIAELKARSAARYRRSTKVFADALAAGRMGLLSLPGLVASEGGLPILLEGRVIGAIGVSGGTPEEDAEIAAATLVGSAASTAAPRR